MKYLYVSTVAIVAVVYAKMCFMELDVARAFLNGDVLRPYVYRALVPWIAKMLSVFGLLEDVALVTVIVAFAVGSVFAVRYLLECDHFTASVSVIVFMGAFIYFAKVYDISTVLFFALGLGLLKNKKLGWFLVMYPFACLNRETTILLSYVYAVWYFGRIKATKYILLGMVQGILFLGIRFLVIRIYGGNDGVDFMFRPLENFLLYVENPLLSAIHWLVIGLVGWGGIKATGFFRVAFLVLFPATVINYLLLGWSFEIRVFAEVYPLLVGIVYHFWNRGEKTWKNSIVRLAGQRWS